MAYGRPSLILNRRRLVQFVGAATSTILAMGGGRQQLTTALSAKEFTQGLVPPKVSARAIHAVDATSGATLYSLAGNDRRPVASITKCMTALVTTQAAHEGIMTLEDLVTIQADDQVSDEYSSLYARIDDRISINGLLEGLLIPSGGDCANALARYVGGKIGNESDVTANIYDFVGAMNEFARGELKLRDTYFTDPAGDDDKSGFSTAIDLIEIGKKLLADPTLSWIVSQPKTNIPSTNGDPYIRDNSNRFLTDLYRSDVVGIKTGSTPGAGASLLVARQVNGGNNLVVMAVLGSDLSYGDKGEIVVDERYADVDEIFSDMDSRFSWVNSDGIISIFPTLQEEMNVWGVAFGDQVSIPIATGSETRPDYQLVIVGDPDPGAYAGEVVFYSGEHVTSSVQLYKDT